MNFLKYKFDFLIFSIILSILSLFFFVFQQHLVLVLVISPLIISIILFFIPNYQVLKLKQISLIGSICIFLFSVFIYIKFLFYDETLLWSHAALQSQFKMIYPLIPSLNIYYSVGLDSFSIWFIILSTFLIPICILVSWENIKFRIKEFLLVLLFLEFLLIQIFSITDLIIFYLLFESVLIPMFIMIGVWGSRERKIFAAYQFFIYTFIGSVFMLIALLYLYILFGTSSYHFLLHWTPYLSEIESYYCWLAFFFAFAIKVPMIPVHVWLPEAHVEAPTAGSVLLAGILLKLGGYGMLRFLIPLFPKATIYFLPLVYCICILGIIYTSAVTVRQVDLKKIIAYSSVAHMNFVILGLFSLNLNGIEGGIFLMLSHGIVSSALFICIGILYDRYHSRLIFYYGGLNMLMPLYSVFFFLFTLANMGLPGLSNFVGELLVLIGLVNMSPLIAILAAIGTILGAIYSIWLYNRLMFGNLQIEFIQEYADLNKREFFILFWLFSLVIFFGIYPYSILSTLAEPIWYTLSNYQDCDGFYVEPGREGYFEFVTDSEGYRIFWDVKDNIWTREANYKFDISVLWKRNWKDAVLKQL